MSDCKHDGEQFQVAAEVAYIKDVDAFRLIVKVACAECGEPFQFIGLPVGCLCDRPTCDMTQRVADLPIMPAGQTEPRKYPGFRGPGFTEELKR